MINRSQHYNFHLEKFLRIFMSSFICEATKRLSTLESTLMVLFFIDQIHLIAFFCWKVRSGLLSESHCLMVSFLLKLSFNVFSQDHLLIRCLVLDWTNQQIEIHSNHFSISNQTCATYHQLVSGIRKSIPLRLRARLCMINFLVQVIDNFRFIRLRDGSQESSSHSLMK